MIYCINPECKQRQNPDDLEYCQYCATPLLINEQYKLIEPLRPLDQYNPTDVFEVDDRGVRKVMKVLKSDAPKLVELMEREATVLQLVDIPGIPLVDIDGYFSFTLHENSPKLHCLVIEKISGYNLEEWVSLCGSISQPLALNWLKQLVVILDKLHSFGFFHRDIKPPNIILKPDGQLVLIDFGAVREVTDTYMAKVSLGSSSSTHTSDFFNVTVISTACYTPLEQINGKAVPQSDFFALGRTFVYLLTGIPLLNISNDRQNGNLLWRQKAPQVDESFADLIDELMALFPGKRPHNTQLILQRLKRLPVKSKLNKIANSSSFKVVAIALFLLGVFGCYKWFFLQEAKRYFELGLRNEAVGRRQEAKKQYERSIQINPTKATTHFHLAFNCHKLNDFPCAYRHYQQALRLKPRYWEAHYNLGSLYDEQGKYDQAESHYKFAVGIDKNLALEALNNMARLKNRSRNYAAAVELSQQGLEKAKDPVVQAALYKNLGWALLKQHYYADARTNLEKSLSLDPQRADTYCLLAQVQDIQKDTDSAKLSWEVCLRVSSDLPEVEGWRQQVLERLFK